MVGMKEREWVKGKMVGCGSYGSVHLAMKKSTGGLFVVKSAHSGNGREALDNEVKILNRLKNSSPYIVRWLGTEEEEEEKIGGGGGGVHVLMEYMAGGSLAEVASKFGGSLDEEVVRLYTREILHGLKDLHRHGIVHCDLKCKNVLLGLSGNVKLADFGCAKRVKDLKKNKKKKLTTNLNGSPLWMAPEVLRNDESVDYYAADIWSLGCTIIEMATGTPPWLSNSNPNPNPMPSLFSIAHGHDLPQFPPHFSKEGFHFLTLCLERDPNKRSTVDHLLSHPFLNSQTTLTQSVTVAATATARASSPASVLDVSNFQHFSSLLLSSDDNCQLQLDAAAAAAGSGNNWITIR